MRYLFFIISLTLMLSCTEDKAVSINSGTASMDLEGKWDMVTAYKGRKESKMLNKGYFTFDSLGNFSTNILGDNKSYPFKLSGNAVKVNNPDKSTYNVLSKTRDTLILSAKLRNLDFKFITTRDTSQAPSDIK